MPFVAVQYTEPTLFYHSCQGEECPPPPPVSWGHVTGLQASLLGHLRGFVKDLDNPVQKDVSLVVIPAYLAYLEAYYHQLSRQVLLLAALKQIHLYFLRRVSCCVPTSSHSECFKRAMNPWTIRLCFSEVFQAGRDPSGNRAAGLRGSRPSDVPPCFPRADGEPKVCLTHRETSAVFVFLVFSLFISPNSNV